MTQVIALSRVSIPGIIVDGDSANGKTVHGRGATLGHTTAQTQQPAPCNNGENEGQANAGTQGKETKSTRVIDTPEGKRNALEYVHAVKNPEIRTPLRLQYANDIHGSTDMQSRQQSKKFSFFSHDSGNPQCIYVHAQYDSNPTCPIPVCNTH